MFLAALVGLVGLTAPASAKAAVPDGGAVIAGNRSEPLAQIDAAKRAGVPWVSLLLNWREYEPTPGEYAVAGTAGAARWQQLDEILNHARARNVKVLVVFSRAPWWANGNGPDNAPPTPDNYGAYAQFLGVVASTFGDRIDAYGTWNEPNIPRGWNPPNPAAFAQLHRQASAAISARDAGAKIVLGPIAADLDFVRAVYAAGVRGTVDVVGWNTYPPTAPDGSTGFRRQFQLASILRKLDPGVTSWITEISWSTCVGCVLANVASPAVQADYLLRTYAFKRRYLHGFTEKVFWYNVVDSPNPRSWSGNHGLLENDFSAKPAYRSMASVASVLRIPRKISRGARVTGSARVDGLKLTSSRGRITVRAGVRLPRSGGTVIIQGYWRGKWVEVSRLADTTTGALRATVQDRGYRVLRVVAIPDGRAAAFRSAAVPKGPKLTSSRG